MCDHRPVHVIGAGNSAGQAAMFLSKTNSNVNLVVRGGGFAQEHVVVSLGAGGGERAHQGAAPYGIARHRGDARGGEGAL